MLPSRVQLENSVISHAPKDAIGPLFVDVVRGPILPPRGTKERDWQLRVWDQADFNTMWQGARSGLVKKIAHIPFVISGPPEKVQYYQDLLGYAHFSQGYEYLIEMWGRDYLTQSYGGIFEIAGPGDPDTQLLEPPTGINHLDAGRCYVTGNPTYPILYYSLWDGKLHRMHASRVYQIVDDPIPDERYFGLGTSALERAIAINQREVRMNQYVDTRLDDMPQPGMLTITGASDNQWQAWINKYIRETSSDALGPFGKTIVITSVDPTVKVEAQSIPFAQTPEKFDLVTYKSLDVDEICLAIGIDRQEIWELAGRGLGSGSQSQVMAEKAKGKTTGTMISALERFMNWAILPDDCEFEIKMKDEAEQSTTATLNLQYAQTAAALTTAGFTKEEIARVLVEGSQTYKDAFTDDAGRLTLESNDPGTPPQLPTIAPTTAAPATTQTSSTVTGEGDTPLNAPPQQGSPAPMQKDYNPDQPRAENGEWGSGGGSSSSGGSRSETPKLSTSEHIQKVSELGQMSDQVNKLNRQTAEARHNYEILYDRRHITPPAKLAKAETKVNLLKQELDKVYQQTLDHSHKYGLTELPKPSALSQRKAFSITRIDFESGFSRILARAVKGGARPNQIENLMLGLLQSSGVKAFTDGLREGGVNDAPDDGDLQEIQNIISDSIDYLDPMLQEAFDGNISPSDVQARAEMWANKTLTQFLNAGRISADKNASYEWFLGNTKEHCDGSHGGVPCPRLAGQVHRFKEWYSRDLLPQSDRLDCKGFNCGCKLMRTDKPAQGRF